MSLLIKQEFIFITLLQHQVMKDDFFLEAVHIEGKWLK
jgi:hypothetical protein